MSNNNTLVLDFEKNIVEIEAKIESLKLLAKDQDVDIAQEVNRLEQKLEKQVKLTYANLTPWQKLQVSRHPQRPHCLDYVHALIEDFTPLCGDRLFGDDEAMIGGIGRFKNISVVVIGQEKGSDLETRMKHNFGMAKPEGYRKAQRLMDMADKFNMPVIAFVDTDGAFPGIDAEARARIVQRVEHDHIHILALELILGMLEPVIGLEREAHQQVAAFACAQFGGDVRGVFKFQRHALAAFFDLFRGHGAGAEIRLGTRTMLNGAAEIRTRK